MDKKVKVVALGAVLDDQGRILISHRNEPQVPESHLKWDLMGGTIEFGETPEDAIIREVEEESGLIVTVADLLPHVASRVWQHDEYLFHALVLCYTCKVLSGTAEARVPKIATLKWISTEELQQYDFLPTVQPFIRLIQG